MGKAENKHPLTLILAVAVFFITIACVLISLPGPAKALSDAKCEEWAQEIKARTEDLSQDPDIVEGEPRANKCPNLCLADDPDTDLKVTGYGRTIGQAGTIVAATIIEFLDAPLGEGGQPIGDNFFSTGVFGMGAFFCGDINNTGNFTHAVVSTAHPAQTSCGTGFTRICTTTLSD